MKRNFLFCLTTIVLLLSRTAFAQVPQAIPYQAVARDLSGNLFINKPMSVRITIHDSIVAGPVLFSETHQVVTNPYGLFTLTIGRGMVLTGIFDAINWRHNPKYLQVELDTANGSAYIDMGTQELLSVPYAFYAEKSNFDGVLRDTSILIINTSSNDTVFIVDKTGKSKHKGREFFFGGIWIFGDTLILSDSSGAPVIIFRPDGTSWHKGREDYMGGILVGDSTKSRLRIYPDGSIEMIDSTGTVVYRQQPDGTSFHQGIEYFKGGLFAGDSLSHSYLRIWEDGSIHLFDSLGIEVFRLNADGSSYHKGEEIFAGGISVTDSSGAKVSLLKGGIIEIRDSLGNVTFKVNQDGSSVHAGLEKFEGGIQVGQSLGTRVHILPNGSIQVIRGSGELLFELLPDGTSFFKGRVTLNNGIMVRDSSGNPAFAIDSSGESFHYKNERFYGDILLGSPGATRIHLRQDGSIECLDSSGAVTFRVNADGTSFHRGKARFAGGVQADDSLGNPAFVVDSAGRSFHYQAESFREGLLVGGNDTLQRLIIDRDGSIYQADSLGNIIYWQDATDYSSYHYGHEIFENGFSVASYLGSLFGFSSPKFEVKSDGSLFIRDSTGQITTRIDASGTSFHKGNEKFEAGIVIGYGSGSLSGMVLGSAGDLIITNAAGQVIFQINNDGTSYHYGQEEFAAGLVSNGNIVLTGTHTISGNGALLTNLDATAVSTGTLSDLRLSSNVPLKNTVNVFTQAQSVSVPGGTAFTATGPLTGMAGQFNGRVGINAGFLGPGLNCSVSSGLAAQFTGDVNITGNLNVSGSVIKGGGTFRIDHPLDPRNKYLNHSFVESPDMMNLYSGRIVLDENGRGVVTMPDWFEALNKDFQYQLTCIGAYAPVFIEREIENNRFSIAGGTPNLKVSWQVTGVRHDPYAVTNKVIVEEEKPDTEKGKFLHPSAIPRK